MHRTLLFSLSLAIWAIAAPTVAQTSILLADDSRPARVTVSWPTRDQKTVTHTGDRPYQSSAQKKPFAPNIDVYIGLGGTRLGKGLADPKGATLLVGLYKQEAKKPFFQDIADNASITITLDKVFMNQPASPRDQTAMMHLRYMPEDLKACGLSGDARNLFNTRDPKDPIIEKATGNSVRAGCLDGKDPSHGSVLTKVEPDGSLTLTLTFPYPLLRHTQDPYQRTNPGGFFEPNHFHFEIELLPATPAKPVDKPVPSHPADPPPPHPEPAEPKPANPSTTPRHPLALISNPTRDPLCPNNQPACPRPPNAP